MIYIYPLVAFLGISTLIMALYAHWSVRHTYMEYSRESSRKRITGQRLARSVLDDIEIQKIRGVLTDHYDPQEKVMRLSKEVADGNSIAALSIAAHETGHALQDRSDYLPFRLRNSLVPIINTGAFLIFPFIFVGSIFDRTLTLVNIGILLFGLTVIFCLITLPVEFDASHRAISIIRENEYLDREETEKAKKVLLAAALTYITATIIAVIQLFRFFILRKT